MCAGLGPLFRVELRTFLCRFVCASAGASVDHYSHYCDDYSRCRAPRAARGFGGGASSAFDSASPALHWTCAFLGRNERETQQFFLARLPRCGVQPNKMLAESGKPPGQLECAPGCIKLNPCRREWRTNGCCGAHTPTGSARARFFFSFSFFSSSSALCVTYRSFWRAHFARLFINVPTRDTCVIKSAAVQSEPKAFAWRITERECNRARIDN